MRPAAAIVAALIASSPGLAASDPIGTLAGAYRHSRKMNFWEGDRMGSYLGESVLEIVRIDRERAYIRTRLMFDNAHICALWGVARVEAGGLVYRGPARGRETCTLTIAREKDQIVLRDENQSCHAYHCGARGWMDKVSFPASSKRSITYMARLKASREYAEALAEDAKR